LVKNKLNIFLLIGQSNMSGRGLLADVPKLSHPEVQMFRENCWTSAVEPLHTDRPEIVGVGLGMRFAIELIEAGGFAPIGLIPCAVGSSPLSRWMPKADLYENTVATVKAALEYGNLAGILWHQGENDSGSRDDAASYGERFSNMIENLRADLSAESVPVIAGELGHFLKQKQGYDFFDLVNQQLRDLEGSLPAYACVGAEGLNDKGDVLHFDATSLREFGHRYAKRFLSL